MRKDTTKKFLMNENSFGKRMTSQATSRFIAKKMNTNQMYEQKDYDLIEFNNVFNVKKKISHLNISNKPLISGDKERNIVSLNNKLLEFNMVYCDVEKMDQLSFFELENSFFVGETLVTQELYELVMGENPSWHKDINKYPNAPKHPVEQVSWYDAITFCNRLSKLQGLDDCYKISNMSTTISYGESTTTADVAFYPQKNGYRLPTINEWTYVLQARTNVRYGTASDITKLDACAWLKNNSMGSTHPVATKMPNELGIYDMMGNVREWCNDGDLRHKKTKSMGYDENDLEALNFVTWVLVYLGFKNLGFRIVRNHEN